jgi:hypothetical protein
MNDRHQESKNQQPKQINYENDYLPLTL